MDVSSIFVELKKTFHSRRLASFVTVSTAIHIALLVSIPSEIINQKKTQPEIFDVDLVPSHSRPSKKISTKPFRPLKAADKTNKFKMADNNKTNLQTKNSQLTFENEATVSLFPDSNKQSKYSSYLSHLRFYRINYKVVSGSGTADETVQYFDEKHSFKVVR